MEELTIDMLKGLINNTSGYHQILQLYKAAFQWDNYKFCDYICKNIDYTLSYDNNYGKNFFDSPLYECFEDAHFYANFKVMSWIIKQKSIYVIKDDDKMLIDQKIVERIVNNFIGPYDEPLGFIYNVINTAYDTNINNVRDLYDYIKTRHNNENEFIELKRFLKQYYSLSVN